MGFLTMADSHPFIKPFESICKDGERSRLWYISCPLGTKVLESKEVIDIIE